MKKLRAIAIIGAIVLCLAIFFESRPDQAVIYEGEIDQLDMSDKFSDAIGFMRNGSPFQEYHKKGIEALRRDIEVMPADSMELREINNQFLLSVDTLLAAWGQYEAGEAAGAEEKIQAATGILSAADRELNKYKRTLG